MKFIISKDIYIQKGNTLKLLLWKIFLRKQCSFNLPIHSEIMLLIKFIVFAFVDSTYCILYAVNRLLSHDSTTKEGRLATKHIFEHNYTDLQF